MSKFKPIHFQWFCVLALIYSAFISYGKVGVEIAIYRVEMCIWTIAIFYFSLKGRK